MLITITSTLWEFEQPGGQTIPFEGDTFEDLHQAIQSAFPSREELNELLTFDLSQDLDTISPPGDAIGTAVFKVIKKAQSRGWLGVLVNAAKTRVPDNDKLKNFDIGRLEAVHAAQEQTPSTVPRESARPAISVCTITKRTEPQIGRMIHLLMEQPISDIEYLIIDGYYHARRDRITKLINELAPGFKVRHLPPKPTRWQFLRPALANARNTYLIWAEGKLIVELDDCCVGMCPDFLEKHLEWSVKGFCVSGSWTINGWSDERQDEYPEPTKIGPDHFYSGNRSYPLQKALDVNGFEEILDGEQGQDDIVFAFMLSIAKVRFMYDPTLRVDYDAASHTLTQLSPDPRKAKWGQEPWAVEPKKKKMGDGTLHYANEWLAHEILTSVRARPEGNNFTLSELRQLPPDADFDIQTVQRSLEDYVDPDPTDWRDGEQISNMTSVEFVHFLQEDRTIAQGPLKHAQISNDTNQIVVVAGRTLTRFTRSIRKYERIELDVKSNGVYISPVTGRVIVPSSRMTRIYNAGLADFHELRKSEDEVHAVCVSRSERYIAAGGWDQAVYVWDFKTYDLVSSFKKLGDAVTSLVFLDDEKHIVAGMTDGYTYLCELGNGKQLMREKRSDHPISVLVPFTLDDKPLILVGTDKALAICDPSSSNSSPLPLDHTEGLRHAHVTSNGAYAVTAHSGGEVRVWDVRRRSLLQTLLLSEPALALKLALRSQELWAVTSAGKLLAWQINPRFRQETLD